MDMFVGKRRDQITIGVAIFLGLAIRGKPLGRIGLRKPVPIRRFEGRKEESVDLIQIYSDMILHHQSGDGLHITR